MASVVGKTIFSDGKGKLFFGYYKDNDAVEFVDYRTWKKLSFKDVSKGKTNKERVIKAILKNQKQFNKKVDFNMWAKKNNPSFEQTMDWFIQNGWISNVTKRGIKESVNEEKVYIDFLNKKKGFKQDRIKFNSYEDAVKWAKKNFEKFNPDMIKYESVNEEKINRKKLSNDLWDRKGYDYKYLNKLSDKKLKSLWDTEFYYESVNEDTKKRFDVDFYKSNSDRQTSHEQIIRGDKFSDVVEEAQKILRAKKYEYAEFYYKDKFLGSIHRGIHKFKPGRDYKSSPISVFESVNEGISVSDERHFGKKGIIIMIDDNGKKVSAIFKDKKNADKYNRNNPSDIKKLLDLAKKTKYPKAIDESVNEGKDDFMARHGRANINLKKGYKHHTADELEDLYNKLGKLVKGLKVKDVNLVFESVNKNESVNEAKYTNQTGIKSALMKDSNFSSLLNPKEIKWINGSDVKIYKGIGMNFSFTDGKSEMIVNVNKPMSIVKKLGRVGNDVKKVYQQNESVNEAKFGYKDSTASYINKHKDEYKQAEKMNKGNEKKFYDLLQQMEEKIGHSKTMLFISNALRGYKVDMFKDPKIKNPADAQEALFLLSK